MKSLIFICLLFYSSNGFAQNANISTPNSAKKVIEYIGSNDLKGSSDAIIAGEVALAHTRQFSSLNKNGKIIGKGNLSAQFDEIFKNIAQALDEAASNRDQIIKLNIFLKNADLISELQPLISRRFSSGKMPSISYVAGDLTHPEALLSIDAIATSNIDINQVRFAGPKDKGQAKVAILPKGPVVYVSGQAAKGALKEATRGTLKQLSETLTSLGLTLKDIVQIKSFLSPVSSLNIVEKEISDFFKGETIPPLVFVDWISSDPVIEIELIAASPVKSQNNDQIEYITPPGMTASPVYSKVVRLNHGKKVYISSIHGERAESPDAELTTVFNSMQRVLRASSSDFSSLLKATYYISKDQYSKSLADLRPKYYDPKRPPAASKAMVRGVGLNGAGISIDMIGTIKE